MKSIFWHVDKKIKLEVVLYLPDEPIDTEVAQILSEDFYEADNLFFQLERQIENIIHEQKN